MTSTTAIHLTNIRAARRPKRRIDPLGAVGTTLFTCFLLAGIAGALGLLGSGRSTVGPRLSGPGPGYPLGTDELGRSLLPRIAEGIGTTVLLSALAVAIGAAIGIALGCIAAYRGGWVDDLIGRFGDILFGFPLIIVAILITVVVGPGPFAATCGIIVATIPLLMRAVRARSLDVVHRDFVVVARVAGSGMLRIIARHLLPNARNVILVQLAYALSVAMLIEGSLSFLGFGVQQPAASLGSLIGAGRNFLLVDPGYALIPAMVLALTVLSVNLIGDSLQRSGTSGRPPKRGGRKERR